MSQVADISKWPIAFPAFMTIIALTVMTAIMVFILSWLAKVMHNTGDSGAVRALLTIMISLSFVGAVFMMMVRTVPENEGVGLLMGGLISAFANVVTYHFTERKTPPPTDEEPPQ